MTNTLNTHKLPPIYIVGCGYIGKKLVQKLLDNPVLHSTKIYCMVKSDLSKLACKKLGVNSFVVDLDQPGSELPVQLQTNHILYYFVPPPNQGVIDNRAHRFIHLLKQQHLKPKKIVLISTTGVYGNCHGQWIDENTPINPSVDRAKRRTDAEQHFQGLSEQFNIPMVILRVAGIYAADKLPLNRIKAQTPIVRAEDSPFSNRIHAHDLVKILVKAGLEQNIEGIFNCADGNPSTMYDYFTHVAKTMHLTQPPAITLEQAKTQLSPGMLSYMGESRRINIQKLLSTFNISLKYPDLKAGLSGVVNDQKKS